MESIISYVVRSFLPNGVFLPSCDHGLGFCFFTSAYYVIIQSINQKIFNREIKQVLYYYAYCGNINKQFYCKNAKWTTDPTNN